MNGSAEKCLNNSMTNDKQTSKHKLGKRQSSEQPNEQKNKRNARLHKNAAESAENISGTKQNQNI